MFHLFFTRSFASSFIILPLLVLMSSQTGEASASTSCPYQTPQDWQNFLEVSANQKQWVKTCEDSTCDSKYYQHVKEKIVNTFDQCGAFIAQHESINQCTKNLRKFTPTWMRQHDVDSYGFSVDNHTYLMDQEAPDKPPGMMKVPDAIVAALPDRNKVERVARENGWMYLTHDSALGGLRTFVVITDPAGRFDQWMLLNLHTGNASLKEGTPMSVLSVQKKDSSGRTLSQVRLHFRDYTVNHTPKGYSLSLYDTNNGKCYSCHASGMRQLIARRTPTMDAQPSQGEHGIDGRDLASNAPDFGFQRLMELNRRIRSYGTVDWNGRVIPENHGPALGKAQGCLDCHDGKTRGILTVSTSTVQLKQKIFHELGMPPDSHLTRLLERSEMKNPELAAGENLALANAFNVHDEATKKFEDSKFPALKGWLLETPCR